ncbi:MAG: DnaB domain-containing protein helicase domain-containing protein [Microgenomates group bacterium Gr01-1014_7]|nr:MAG: DnaB domain-containing protein helicase domain-containing protein [Microgenomates group bacterium Gr01-1014_7]
MINLDWAKIYLTKHKLVPLPSMGKKSKGKEPLVEWAGIQELPSVEQVEAWFNKFPNANIGTKTGKVAGILVLDNDGVEITQLMPLTPTATSRPGHFHSFFKNPDFYVPPSASKIGEHLDIRCDQAFIVLPPSKHFDKVTGEIDGEYTWIDGMSPDDIPFAPCPDWLIAKLKETISQNHGFDWSGAFGVGIGGRDETLARAAASLAGKKFNYEVALSILRGINSTYPETKEDPRPDDASLIAKLDSAFKKFKPSDPDVQKSLVDLLDRFSSVQKEIKFKLQSGFASLDRSIQGFRSGAFYVFGGLKKSGKSSLLMNILSNLLKSGTKVGYIDTELPFGDFVNRFTAISTDNKVEDVEANKKMGEQWLQKNKDLLFYANKKEIQDTNGFSKNLLKTLLKQWVDMGVKVVVFDNLTTVNTESDGNKKGWEKLADFVDELIDFARDNQILVFAVIHTYPSLIFSETPEGIRHLLEKEKLEDVFKKSITINRRPSARDLYGGGGALSQISGGVLLLWRPFQDFNTPAYRERAMLILEDFRNGSILSEIEMTFKMEKLKFNEVYSPEINFPSEYTPRNTGAENPKQEVGEAGKPKQEMQVDFMETFKADYEIQKEKKKLADWNNRAKEGI